MASGPADPGDWDHWFGELNAFAEGGAEAEARARKAAFRARDWPRSMKPCEPCGKAESRRGASQALPEAKEDWLYKKRFKNC